MRWLPIVGRSRSVRAACLATLALVGTLALLGMFMATAPIRADAGEAGGCYWTSSWAYDAEADAWYEYWYEVCEPDPPPPDPPPPDPPPPPPPDPVYGCPDPSATNYNSTATANDGSCQYPPPPPPPPVYGCIDPSATNYNPTATADDGSCQYPQPAPTTSLSAEASQGVYGNSWYPLCQ